MGGPNTRASALGARINGTDAIASTSIDRRRSLSFQILRKRQSDQPTLWDAIAWACKIANVTASKRMTLMIANPYVVKNAKVRSRILALYALTLVGVSDYRDELDLSRFIRKRFIFQISAANPQYSGRTISSLKCNTTC